MATNASDLGLPLQPLFAGSAPMAYRLDAGAIRFANAQYGNTATFVDSSKITLLRIRPRWVNAPAALFKKQDKVNAYLRISVNQSDNQQPLKSQLSWTGIFQLNTAPHQDMPSGSIGDVNAQNALDGITIPNGSGTVALTWSAVVGPPSTNVYTILDSTYKKLRGLAGQQQNATVLAIPAASIAVADQIEGLVGSVALAFDKNSEQQRWLNPNNPTQLIFVNTSGAGDGQGIALVDGVPTQVILVADESNPGDRPQLEAAMADPNIKYPRLAFQSDIISYSDFLVPYLAGGTKAGTFKDSPNGEVRPTDPTADNPFAFVPYVTVELTATASDTPNQKSASTFAFSGLDRATALSPLSFLSAPLGVAPTDAPLPEVPKTNYCTSHKGQFQPDPSDPKSTSPADMAAGFEEMKRALDDGTAKSVALFFHGGLVSEQSGYETAQILYGPYGNVPSTIAPNPGRSYPYFFLYETGPWETLRDIAPQVLASAFFKRLFDLIKGRVQQTIPSIAAQTLSYMDGQLQNQPSDAAINAAINALKGDVASDPVIAAECRKIASYQRVLTLANASPSAALLDGLSAEVQLLAAPVAVHMMPAARERIAKGLQGQSVAAPEASELAGVAQPSTLGIIKDVVEIGWRIFERYKDGHHHRLACTITEEIVRQLFLDDLGFQMWSQMKDDAAAACDPMQKGVATAAIRLFDSMFWSKGAFPRIVLIGHSEGTFFIGKFLEAVEEMVGQQYDVSKLNFDVIFLAAACRTDFLSGVLQSRAGERIAHFRAFGMADAYESAELLLQLPKDPLGLNPILGALYPSSLLYYISGVLERDGAGNDFPDAPLVGMQRFFTGEWPFTTASRSADISRVDEFKRKESVYSPTDKSAPAGWQSGSVHHGGFPDDPQTLQSCCYLLANPSWPDAARRPTAQMLIDRLRLPTSAAQPDLEGPALGSHAPSGANGETALSAPTSGARQDDTDGMP